MTCPAWSHSELRSLAEQSGVWEYGGRAAGWQGQVLPRGFKSQREMNAEGRGRTVWIRPEWCKGFGYSKAQIMAIVEKAIAGKRLGRQQSALIEVMLATLGVDELGMRWHTMTGDEKEGALDEIFGADSRPKPAAKTQAACQTTRRANAEKASPRVKRVPYLLTLARELRKAA